MAGSPRVPDGQLWASQISFPSTSISDKGCLQKENRKKKEKKKEKFLRTFPQVWLWAGSEGGAYSLIRRGGSAEARIGARGPGPGERAWGRGGSAPAGAARAGSGLISNRGLDCSWTATLPRPASRLPAAPAPVPSPAPTSARRG